MRIRNRWVSLFFLTASISVHPRAESSPSDRAEINPPPRSQHHISVQSRPAMGTILSISLCESEGAIPQHLFDELFQRVEHIENRISEWRPTSEVSRLAARAGTRAEDMSEVTERFLRLSLLLWHQTEGVFDITYRTPRASRRPDATKTPPIPPIQLNHGQAFLSEKGAIIDTGGIGKGFALDELIPLVKQLGISCALFDLGGSSFLAIGAPPHEKGWRLISESDNQSPLLLRDQAASTSSARMISDGPLPPHPHIVDPRTNRPIASQRHTTVVCPSAGIADALSTFTIVVGPKEAETTIKKLGCTLISDTKQ